MGKQSSRLYYDGNDHKDIYFQGRYHRAMYLGSNLLWEKLPSEKFFLLRYNYTSGNLDYSYPASFDVGSHVLTRYVDYKTENEMYTTYGNNLFTYLGGNIFTCNGKDFFESDIFESGIHIDFRITNGYIKRKPKDTSTSTVYYIKTDRSVNELSETELFETPRYFTSRVLGPCYPYYYDYLVFSRSYDNYSYYSECLICDKTGKYQYEYKCDGHILFCYCDKTINLIFTDSGSVHVFENGSVKYKINIGLIVYACIRCNGEYILYTYDSNTKPFAIYKTKDFINIESSDGNDHIKFESDIPFILILNGDESANILKKYDDPYWSTLRAVDIRTQLTYSSLFEDGTRADFDSIILNIKFLRNTGNVYRRIYIDNLLFKDSENNYSYFG